MHLFQVTIFEFLSNILYVDMCDCSRTDLYSSTGEETALQPFGEIHFFLAIVQCVAERRGSSGLRVCNCASSFLEGKGAMDMPEDWLSNSTPKRGIPRIAL